jgi:hypothetical protein
VPSATLSSLAGDARARGLEFCRSMSRPAAAPLFTGLLGASFGVLGWLLAQALTFGAAEHTHLTVHGMTSHRHDYAAPTAAGAGLVALASLLFLLVLHLSSQPHGTAVRQPPGAPPGLSGQVGSRASSIAPVVAAGLFVGVESVDLVGSGAPASVVGALLATGAAAQLLVARAMVGASRAVARGIEQLTVPRAALAPTSTPSEQGPMPVHRAGRSRVMDGAWDGRAPPRARGLVLIPVL